MSIGVFAVNIPVKKTFSSKSALDKHLITHNPAPPILCVSHAVGSFSRNTNWRTIKMYMIQTRNLDVHTQDAVAPTEAMVSIFDCLSNNCPLYLQIVHIQCHYLCTDIESHHQGL